MDALLQVLGGVFAVQGTHHIKDEVGVVRAAGDAEIVHGELRVDLRQQVGRHDAAFGGFFITDGDGVHMDADLTAQLVVDLPFHRIDDIMDGGDIVVLIHLGVQRGKQPSGAVIVDDEIVQTEDLRRGQRQTPDAGDQRGIGRTPQQRVNGVLHGGNAGIQNEYRHQYAEIAIELDAEEMPGQRTQQHHRSRGHIAQAVGGGGHHGGGVDLFAQLAVKEIHPALDQNGDRQDDKRQQGKIHRLGGKDLLEGGLAQLEAHEQDDDRDRKPGEVFHTAVAEGVIPVGLLPRQPEADEGHDGGAGIGKVIEGIGGDGDRAGHRTGDELAEEQQNIKADAGKPA